MNIVLCTLREMNKEIERNGNLIFTPMRFDTELKKIKEVRRENKLLENYEYEIRKKKITKNIFLIEF